MPRLSELLRRLGGDCPRSFRGLDPRITSIAIDSREVRPGALFAALPGTTSDGARFVPDAVERGAVAVLTGAKTALAPAAGFDPARTPVWTHPQVRDAVGRTAAFLAGDPTEELEVYAVTGTNGKTTVAHFLAELLEREGRRPARIGTVGYRLAGGRERDATHTTPPPTVLQPLFAEHRELGGDCAVLEASSHALDQARLAGTTVDVAVFTNLTRDHLDYHADMESYGGAKERLFRMLGPDGFAVVHGHDPASERMAAAARAAGAGVVTFGAGPDVDLRALDVVVERGATGFAIEGMGIPRTPVRLPQLGRHNVLNALAAVAAALVRGASPSRLVEGLAAVSPAPGRLEPVRDPAGDVPFSVYVDYAHTDSALCEVLRVLREVLQLEGRGGRLLCVFGCGGGRDVGKRAPMGRVVGEGADVAIVTSDNPRGEDPERIAEDVLVGLEGTPAERHVEVDRRAAIELAARLAREGDLVLVAGRGHEPAQEVRGEKLPFDDRVVVAEVLQGVCA